MLPSFVQRSLKKDILAGLAANPAVYINGPRQAGKSTLARSISESEWPATYITFDDGIILSAAQNDPLAFARNFMNQRVVIDEAQRVPGLFLQLKYLIDEARYEAPARANGRFLLTGSSNIMATPALAEALVGRMRILTLGPLSVPEISGSAGEFAEALFIREFSYAEPDFRRADLPALIREATFPILYGKSRQEAQGWLHDYVSTLVQRDIRELADIEKAAKIPDLLNIFAAHGTGLMNEASLARDIQINSMTFRRYRILLESIFVLTLLPAWHTNKGLRLTKAPKIFFNDTLLMSHLLGVDPAAEAAGQTKLWGRLVENFVFAELHKQLANKNRLRLHHFRTQAGKEVDFVIEDIQGAVAGVEVKSRRTIDYGDFSGLALLRDTCGEAFKVGVLLYNGDKIVPFGDRLYAMPLEALWQMRKDSQLRLI